MKVLDKKTKKETKIKEVSKKNSKSLIPKKKSLKKRILNELKILIEKMPIFPSKGRKKLEKKRLGVIVSTKGEKSIVVAVERRFQHPKYAKTLVQTKRYMVHDEFNEGKIGDIVLIQESRPLSKKKTCLLKEIIKSYEKLIL